ncbi:all-trans-retinol 13,14-reductase-like [Branchiostoma floridae x Branchiostoma belcheri]
MKNGSQHPKRVLPVEKVFASVFWDSKGERPRTFGSPLVQQITEGQLQWAELDKSFDIVTIQHDEKKIEVPIKSSRSEHHKTLLEHFPTEGKAIDEFFRLCDVYTGTLSGFILMKTLPLWLVKLFIRTGLVSRQTSFFHYMSRSTREVMDSFTDNKDLKAVLSYNYGDFENMKCKF